MLLIYLYLKTKACIFPIHVYLDTYYILKILEVCALNVKLNFFIFTYLFKFFNLLLERGEGRERKRKRNITM